MSDIEVEFNIIAGGNSGTCRLPSGSEIYDLLRKLDHNPETVVVKRNGKIVPEDEKLESGDKLVIVPVVSGG